MTRTDDGDVVSQSVPKIKRSMKKCEACRTRKIACLPKDREWSENLKEPCNNCDKLDLPCGPSVRSNAKVESAPRKLASKNIPEVSPAGPGAAFLEGVPRSNVTRNDSESLRGPNPTQSRAQAVPSTWVPEREALGHATILPNHNPDVEMALEMTPERNFRIYGAASNSQTTYDSVAVSKNWTGAAPSTPATLIQPSFASNHAQYSNSIQSRSTRMDDVPQQVGGPVPTELHSQNEFESFENAHFPVVALHQPEVLDLNSRIHSLDYAGLSHGQSADTNPSTACGLVPLRNSRNFRVLELFPGHGSAPLAAHLTEVNLESSYEALSYVWDDSSSIPASVDKAIDNTVNAAPIAPNLASALRALRYTEKSRLIWIDTLCINQTDMVEKSSQVTLTGTIYRRAKHICVWLGPESRSSHLAFELIKQSTDLKAFETRIQSPSLVPYWDSFTELMRRPWFRHRWAVQEIALAKDVVVHCGSLQVGWKQLKQTITLFSTKQHDLKRHLRSANDRLLDALHDISQLDANRFIQLSDRVVRKSEEGDILQYIQPLHSLVFRCAYFESRDPRDTIYALLGLSSAGNPGTQHGKLVHQAAPVDSSSIGPNKEVYAPESLGDFDRRSRRQEVSRTSKLKRSPFDGIKIDYAKPVFDVCRDFFLYTIEHSRSLDIICRPWAPNGQELPSWMPTVSGNSYVIGKDAFYRRAHADPLVGYPNLDGLAIYNTARDTGPAYHYDAVLTPRELQLSGFICGAVIAKRVPATAGFIPSSWFDIEQWLDMTDKTKNSFWRTLVADRGPGFPYSAPLHYSLAWDYVCGQRAVGSSLDTTELRRFEKETSVVDEFLARVQSVVWGRRLLLAAVGGQKLLALGPEHTKKTDLICILYGCTVPVLLRKVDDGGQGSEDARYQIVGECYVDSMMNGEALNMKNEYSTQERTFKLV